MLKIEVNTSNAAFHNYENPEYDNYCKAKECERILKEIVGKIRNGYTDGKCVDINGNVVGNWSLK